MADPSYTVEILKPALSFTQSGTYAIASLSGVWSPPPAWTVECWLMWTGANERNFMHPFGLGGENNLTAYVASGQRLLSLKTTIGDSLHDRSLTTSLELLRPYHLAVTYDGSQLSGLLGGSLYWTEAASGFVGNSTSTLFLAARMAGTDFWVGYVDELRLWSAARTQQQILDNMYRTLIGTETGLIGYWKVDEGSGTTLYDATTYARNALAVGPPDSGGWVLGLSWTTRPIDISSDVLQFGISRTIGRATEGLQAGRADIVLDNDIAAYSPENLNGPYARTLRPNQGIRIRAAGTRNLLPYTVADASDATSFVVWGAPTKLITTSQVLFGSSALISSRTTAVGCDSWIGVEVPVQSGAYRFSTFVRGPNGEGVVLATAVVGSASEESSLYALTGTWARFSAERTFDNSMEAQFFVRMNSATTAYYMDGWQVETTPDLSQWAPGTGITYDLFRGFIDRFTPEPALARRSIHIQATDRLKDLMTRRIDLPMRVDINAASFVTEILSASGVTGSDRVIDTTQDVIPFAWFQREPTASVLDEVMRFGAYHTFIGPDGRVNMRNRYWGPGGVVGTAVGSFRDDFWGFRYSLDDATVVNAARVQGTPRKVTPDAHIIARLSDLFTIPASGTLGFTLDYLDPVTKERNTPAMSVTAVRSTDYTAETAATGVQTYTIIHSAEGREDDTIWGYQTLNFPAVDHTDTLSAWITAYGASAVCTMFNGFGDPVLLTRFQLKGYSIQRQPEVVGLSDQASSQRVYGVHDRKVDSDFIGTQPYAQAYAEFLTYEGKDPRAQIDFGLKNQFPEVFARDLGDIVYLLESNTGVASRHAILSVDHEVVVARGLEHSVRYGVEFWRDRGYLVLDDATRGVLDSRRLAF